MRPGGSDRDDAAGLLGTPFRRARFRAAVHYVCWVCEDPRALGARRLGLVLWYAEPNLLFALAPPDLGRLGAEEVAELEAATRGVCLDARATVPRRAAHDAVWRAALIGET